MSPKSNLLLELREAAKAEYRPPMRAALQRAADDLHQMIENFRLNETRERLIDVNGYWSHAERVLKLAREVPEPTPPSAVTVDVSRSLKAA